MNSDERQAVVDFASRLRAAMEAKGHISGRARSGVDVAALARGVGISYEMARRYVEGIAMPRQEAIAKIAAWLGVDLLHLAHGLQTQSSGIDMHALESALLAVKNASAVSGVTLSDEQAARTIAELYAEIVSGADLSIPTVAAMLRAMGSR